LGRHPLLALIDAVLLFAASQGLGARVVQNAGLVLVQLSYLVPLIVIFAYRRANPLSLGFGRFDWNTLGLGCGLLIASYLVILGHNIVLTLLGVNTQGEQILQLFGALDSPLWFIIVGVIVAPVVEELFFRGFLFQGFRQRYGWVNGALLSSAIFAVAHLDPVALIPTFILGVLLAYMYHRTDSVWIPILLHVLVNGMGCARPTLPRRCRGSFPCDQAHLVVVEEILPRPGDQHHQAVAEADDAVDVQTDPDQPGDEPAERNAPQPRHRRVAPDGRQQARVLVMERFCAAPLMARLILSAATFPCWIATVESMGSG
jgi:membrane protease YdiL (CAAX protease family)